MSLALVGSGVVFLAAWQLKATEAQPPRWAYLMAVPVVVAGAVGAAGRFLRVFNEPVREPISDRYGNAHFLFEAGFVLVVALCFGVWGLFDDRDENDLVCALMIAFGLTGAALGWRHLRKPVRGIPVFQGAVTVTERSGTAGGGFRWRERLGFKNDVRYPIDAKPPTATCHVVIADRPGLLCGAEADVVPLPSNGDFSSIPDRFRCLECERELVRLARLASPDGRLGVDANPRPRAR